MKKLLLTILITLVSAASYASGDIDAGKAAVAKYNCASCHAKDGNFNMPIDPSYPKLAGQHAGYIKQALKEYKRGGAAANGRANAIMGAQAKPLSPIDIENIAAYLHSLPGDLVMRK